MMAAATLTLEPLAAEQLRSHLIAFAYHERVEELEKTLAAAGRGDIETVAAGRERVRQVEQLLDQLGWAPSIAARCTVTADADYLDTALACAIGDAADNLSRTFDSPPVDLAGARRSANAADLLLAALEALRATHDDQRGGVH